MTRQRLARHPVGDRGGAATRRIWSVVVAGGAGIRFGGRKQFAVLGGRTVLDWAVHAASAASDGVVVVVPGDTVAELDRRLRRGGASTDVDRIVAVVAGGDTRSASVRAGLAALPADADEHDVVFVHDGARPFADAALFTRARDAVHGGADAAIPGIAVADTIKEVAADGSVLTTPRRDTLRAVQTPQAFRLGALRAAHAEGSDATDDAALLETAGGTVVVVEGDPANRKITDPADLEWARRVLPTDRPVTVRVGQGFDIHRFSDDPDRVLVLGGVRLEGPGLVGHSDADVIAHAVTDALLGAAGLGDIGEHFPDTDPAWAGADSIGMLHHAARLVSAEGWQVGNVDCAVVCETPKLAPHRAAMQARLSGAAGGPVTVKGRRAEGLGALGRREGIACWAVAVLTAVDPVVDGELATAPTEERGQG